MSQKEIEESLALLKNDWEIDSILEDFMLGKRNDVTEFSYKINNVTYHIPYLSNEKSTFYGNVIGQTVIIAVRDKEDYLSPQTI